MKVTIGDAIAAQVISTRDKAKKTNKTEDWLKYEALRRLLPLRERHKY
jgi:hypothetical protein